MQEEPLDLRDYVEVLHRRWWLLLIGPLLGVALALGISLFTGENTAESTGTVVYRATALVLMEDSRGISNVPDLVKVRPVLEGAIEKGGLDLSVPELRAKVAARPISNTNLMEISVEEIEQHRAIATANAVSESLIEYARDLREAQTSSLEFPLQLEALAGLPPESRYAVMNRPAIVAPAEAAPSVVASGVGDLVRQVVLLVFAGSAASVGVVVTLEHLRRPAGSAKRFEASSGAPALGRVPRWRNQGKKEFQLLFHRDADPIAKEALRKAAANLELAALPAGAKTLAVVSPNTGDGRSTLLANLGVALADSWREVVLVDADLRLPSLHRLFGLENYTGLSSVLQSPAMPAESVVQETRHQRLKVVTGGPAPENPLELLRCPRLTWFLEQLKETCDIVLLDTPPALPVADAASLAGQVDGVVLVISDERAGWEGVWAILPVLERTGTLVLGCILNRCAMSRGDFSSQCQRYYRKLEERPLPAGVSGNPGKAAGAGQRSEDSGGRLTPVARP